MSKYSGRSDLFDDLMIHNYTEEQLKNNVKIYVGNSYIPLKIESYKTIIPYYPHLICSSYHNNKECSAIYHVTAESSVDRNEKEILGAYLDRVLEFYKKCKRNKIEFEVEKAIKNVYFVDWNKEQVIEIANRVKENGDKANINGIHIKTSEYYRDILAQEMIRNNINLADYGLERFCKGSEKL